MRLHDAQFGNLQIFDESSGALIILAQKNFRKPFLDHFAVVRPTDGSACSRAIEGNNRVVIEDVFTDPVFEPHRHVAKEAGFQAVQSTPLRNGSGKLLGVLSTHFSMPRRFSDDEHMAADRHAVFVATSLERLL